MSVILVRRVSLYYVRVAGKVYSALHDENQGENEVTLTVTHEGEVITDPKITGMIQKQIDTENRREKEHATDTETVQEIPPEAETKDPEDAPAG